MNCLPDSLTVADVGQWLNGGWFLFERDDRLVPGKLVVTREEYQVQDVHGQTYGMIRAQTFPFWPACGALNLDGFAVYVERRQQRQYRRTYNEQCVTLTVPRKWDAMKKNGTDATNICPNSPTVVEAVFNPIYFTYSQALDMMDTGRATSVALNPHLIVAGTLVYYRNALVAKMEDQRIIPVGCDISRIRRIIKFFEGRVTL